MLVLVVVSVCGVSLANVRRGVSANSGVCFTYPGPVGWLLRLAQMWEAEVESQMTEKLKRELRLYSSDSSSLTRGETK